MADAPNPIAPWIANTNEAAGVPSVTAPWLAEQQPGYIEDMAKTAVPSVIRGGIQVLGAPRDMADLAGAGAKWAAGKAPQAVQDTVSSMSAPLWFHQGMQFLKDESTKSAAHDPLGLATNTQGDMGPGVVPLPSSKDMKDKLEETTGPLYEAKTGPGKALQTGLELAPGLLAGGEGVLPTLTKAAGAAVGSSVLGEAGDALSGHLPSWAPGVMRGAGALVGLGLPSVMRGIITPAAITDPAHEATIAALKTNHPDLLNTATAGQYTNSSSQLAAEGRSGKFAAQPQIQEEALTKEAMGTAGAPGQLATPQALSDLAGKNPAVQGIGQQIGQITNSNNITGGAFQTLKNDLSQTYRKYTGTIGKDNAQTLDDLRTEIGLGAQNNPTNMSMRGPRYQYMRERLQDAIDGASTGTEKTALSAFRSDLDKAFNNSITPAESARLTELQAQYPNFKAISNRSVKNGQVTMSPDELQTAATSKFGNESANMGTNQLSRLASNGSKVMQDLPPRNPEVPPWVDLAATGAGALLHGGGTLGLGGGPTAALAGADEGGVLGHLVAPSLYNAAKDMAARLRSSGMFQDYYKNQLLHPGAATTNDPKTVARLLLTPQGQTAIGNGSQ